MKEIFTNPETLVLLLAFSIPIVSVIAYFWHLTLKNQSDNDLKQSMLEQGMSAEEIERVINAGSNKQKQ